jgi:redox-sensitive bicupin YhaK (pirin superfamily)
MTGNMPEKDKLTPPHYQALTSTQIGVIDLPGKDLHPRLQSGKYGRLE